MPQDEIDPIHISLGFGLIAVIFLTIYCQAVITEERLVPAVNLIASELDVSVYFSKFMVAAAASCSLFCLSIISTFVFHSSLGIGLVVGSCIHNQFIVQAIAIFSSRTGDLSLNRCTASREIVFYTLSLLLLWYSLRDVAVVEGDDKVHLFISFVDSSLLLIGYIAYFFVCDNFNAIVSLLSCTVHLEESHAFIDSSRWQHHENILLDFHKIDNDDEGIDESIGRNEETTELLSGETPTQSSSGTFDISASKSSYDLLHIETDTVENVISCFLWQRSFFYDKRVLSTNGWCLRWFIMTKDSIHSVPCREEIDFDRIEYPPFTALEVEELRYIIRLTHPSEKRSESYLMAPSKEVFHAVVSQMKKIMATSNYEWNNADMNTLISETCDTGNIYSHGSLLEVPPGQTNREKASHILVYPILYLIQHSVPDIRVLNHKGMPTSITSQAIVTVLSSTVWIVLSNYILVFSLDYLAEMMKIPVAIIGCTFISGVSLWPAYVASAMCAEKGFGSSAVLEAMSSNIFNILVVLGIPWLLYTSIGTGFLPYEELRNEGILQLVIFLCLSHGIFIFSILISGFKLSNIHGMLFMVIYASYLAYAFGRVYW